MAYNIKEVFSYSFPTRSVEYIKNYNANIGTISLLPFTASNNDKVEPLTLVMSASKPWILTPIVNLTDREFPIVLDPGQSVNVDVKIIAPEVVNATTNTAITENITLYMVSGSKSAADLQRFYSDIYLNDRFAVKYDNINQYPKDFANPGETKVITQDFSNVVKILGRYTELDLAKQESIYTRSQLLEKKRKLQIILDNFSQPICGYQSIYSYYYGDGIYCFFTNKGEDARYPSDKDMRENKWNFPEADFPGINANLRTTNWHPAYIYIGGSTYGDTVKILKETLRDAMDAQITNPFSFYRFDEGDVTPFDFPSIVQYVQNIVKYFISLIDRILAANEPALSRKIAEPEEDVITIPITIGVTNVVVDFFAALSQSAVNVINQKTTNFYDEFTSYKTLLNFGNDIQYVASAWRTPPSRPENSASIQLKLLGPLDDTVMEFDTAFISRELAKSVIDNIEFTFAPEQDTTPYLRPFSLNRSAVTENKKFVNGVTLESLQLQTGSSGIIVSNVTASYENLTFRRWLTDGFNASELNIDFTDYNNFVHFGSAYERLRTFNEKLVKIDRLTSESIAVRPSSSGEVVIGSFVSMSSVSALLKAKEKEEIIRNFDPYEQFLYYAPQETPYSASAFYAINEIEYNPTGSWPKTQDGTPYSPYSTVVSNWLTTQLAIAQRYDDNNENILIRQLPDHITNDEDSADFLTLVSMVGHVMDNIKVYIDQFPYIYSTNSNPFDELTMDQVYEVAQSFGLNLPNVYSLEKLQTFNASILGESGSRSSVAETWKRFLHNAIYITKAKGTRTSVDSLLNIYGISSPVIQVKETSYPVNGNYIKSDEVSYGVLFTGSAPTSHIKLPFVSGSIDTSTVQIRFRPTTRTNMTLLGGHDVSGTAIWNLQILTGSNTGAPKDILDTLGYIKLLTPMGTVTSSYFPIYSTDFTHIMLRDTPTDLVIVQTDGDQILFNQTLDTTTALSPYWNTTSNIYVGGSGSSKIGTNNIIVDEIHTWKDVISYENFEKLAYDPGSYYGSTYSSSYDNLYIHVAFSQPLTSITQSVTNESPYKNLAEVGTLTAYGFVTSSYTKVLRGIKQYTPIVGSTMYSNKKVNIAPPPVFNNNFIDEDGTKHLKPRESIKSQEDKLYTGGQNIVSIGISPTDFTNQDILRSMGVINVNNLIGSPRYINDKESIYTNLDKYDEYYTTYYRKIINPNEYTRFFKDLTQAITEIANTIVPARTKLTDGIVIESHILKRRKERLFQSVKVSGTATKLLDNFTSGSGYISGSGPWDVGAYDFSVERSRLSALPTFFGQTPIFDSGSVKMIDNIRPISSTPLSKVPYQRKVKQQINATIGYTGSSAYTSLLDEGSGYVTIEASGIDGTPRTDIITTPYARSLFYGIPASGSVTARLLSEENTIPPLYDIPPRADLLDVGVTSYFHKINGMYPYILLTPYKEQFVTKLDTKVDNPLSRLYSKITLLRSGSVVNRPGRDEAIIETATYAAATPYYSGTLIVPNIFSIFGILGQPGLRIRLYKTETDRNNDKLRPYTSPPDQSVNVLFDAILNGTTQVFPYTLVQTEDSKIIYSIENTTGTDITTLISIEYFGYEPANMIPMGYLPRHYKFTRDNTTSLKRRNYLGTQGTDDIPPNGCPWDPCPPFNSRPSAEYTATVSQGKLDIR